jgi:hypothetical protein
LGVGHAVGPAIAEMAIDGKDPAVVFSRVCPADPGAGEAKAPLLQWRAFRDRYGQEGPLPAHVIITSRIPADGGLPVRRHYALICTGDSPLSAADKGTMRLNELVNYSTSRPFVIPTSWP